MPNLDPELDAYLRQALERNATLYQPPMIGRSFRSPLFEFVRTAKAHPVLGKSEAFDAAQTVEEYLRPWVPRESADPWQECFPNSDDPGSEFIDTWDKVKWARAEVDIAFQAAKALPLKPIRAYSANYALFVSIAGHLQRNLDGPILLPCRKFADLLGCEPMTISRYRNLAVKAGILQFERRGRKQHREADEFHFSTEKFDWTTGNEIESKSAKGKCYTDIQELQIIQETERKTESQEMQDMKDSQRDTRPQIQRKRKSRSQSELIIPTTEELARALKATTQYRPFLDREGIQ